MRNNVGKTELTVAPDRGWQLIKAGCHDDNDDLHFLSLGMNLIKQEPLHVSDLSSFYLNWLNRLIIDDLPRK